MPHYRIYRVDLDGRIVSGHDADCDGDDDAFLIANRILDPQARLEIWTSRRLVGCLSGVAAALWWPKQVSGSASGA